MIDVGKRGYRQSCKQPDINAMMVSLAREGLRVVRLKSGDPLIFGRAGEEIEACQNAGIPLSVVPGVTSAQGAAASLKVSLTNRDHARRLQFITAHDRRGHLPQDIDWSAVAGRALRRRSSTCRNAPLPNSPRWRWCMASIRRRRRSRLRTRRGRMSGFSFRPLARSQRSLKRRIRWTGARDGRGSVAVCDRPGCGGAGGGHCRGVGCNSGAAMSVPAAAIV